MKVAMFLFVALLLLTGCSLDAEETPLPTNEVTTDFDVSLAKELGADAYGMRSYVMAFLKAGPNKDQDSTTAAQLQEAHMNNISRMANEGVLVAAGPFMDDSEYKGIYVFAVERVEEAAALTQSDPAVQAGRLVMELHPWYSSAALMQVNELHNRISEIKF